MDIANLSAAKDYYEKVEKLNHYIDLLENNRTDIKGISIRFNIQNTQYTDQIITPDSIIGDIQSDVNNICNTLLTLLYSQLSTYNDEIALL